MVLLLWQPGSLVATPMHAGGHSATLRSGSPAPHQGLPFEQAVAAAEVEPEPGRSKPSGWYPNAATCRLRTTPHKAQVPEAALAFRAQRPRRPLGQAPPPLT